jgi:hypothetical protein
MTGSARPTRRGWAGLTQEARLFARMSAFGLVIGVVYWFLTYEPAGTVLLFLFGVAAGIGAVAEIVGSRRRGMDDVADATGTAPRSAHERLGGPDVEPVPKPGWAPLGIGLGLGGLALGAAFGPALLIAGVIVTLLRPDLAGVRRPGVRSGPLARARRHRR